MKKILFLIGFLTCLHPVFAEENIPTQTITFVDGIYTYTLPLKKYPEFFTEEATKKTRENQVCTRKTKDSPEKKMTWKLNSEEARDFFQNSIAIKTDHEASSVRIYRDEKGAIAFEGMGIEEKKLDIPRAIALLEKAIDTGVTRVDLPFQKQDPEVLVEDPELQKMGIQDLLAVGESNFHGSSRDRIHNISVGANRFNGFLIPQGDIASFNNQLGEVGPSEGYRKELVILGPKVDKEYGGGLCQVSSTAFRAALLSGLPIRERYNHSFAVKYYEPWGTDATIYLGSKDLKFENNTNSAILVQTSLDKENTKLRFHFYGTRDDRTVKMFASRKSNQKSPPAPRYETSSKVPVGTVQRLSNAVTGFDQSWERVISSSEKEEDRQPEYRFFSRYQPRGIWTITGVEEGKESVGEDLISSL